MSQAKPKASPVVHLIRFKEKRVRAQSNHRERNERYLRDRARWCCVVHVYLVPRLGEAGKTGILLNIERGPFISHKKTKPYFFQYGLVSCFSRALAVSRIIEAGLNAPESPQDFLRTDEGSLEGR